MPHVSQHWHIRKRYKGPNQEGLASRAEERAKATGLSSGLEYIVESIVEPDKFIVEGYDKIMPKVYDPPIMLDREKILAVLTYMQTLGARRISVR